MGLYQYQLHVPTCCFFTFDAPSLPNTSLRTVANIKNFPAVIVLTAGKNVSVYLITMFMDVTYTPPTTLCLCLQA